ncbi:MAG: hypothetical protein OXU66_11405 [Gammaproteobacteria bacterium]|nr:hypothetical protein [Gammaproteobacteria bacterium]MDD9894836.1 hypothetical protein [Gammaproteobacteria bacterium]MDD9959536.1 hypothetical protein [Gammaproteobacteria bacterium]
MTESTVLIDKNGPVTTVSMNRAEGRNMCNIATMQGFHAAFAAFESDDEARVAVLTGVGGSFRLGQNAWLAEQGDMDHLIAEDNVNA